VLILTLIWELHLCLMIQNLKDSRVDQNSYYIMTRPVKIILFWCSLSQKRRSSLCWENEDIDGTDNKVFFL
jgi:hypothetical protein